MEEVLFDNLEGYFKVILKFGHPQIEHVNMFIANNIIDINEINSVIIDGMCDIKINNKTKKYYKLPLEPIHFSINFSEKEDNVKKECICKQIYKGKTCVRGGAEEIFDMAYDLILFIKEGNKNDLDYLLEISKLWYNKFILNKDKTKGKINCFSWNEWRWSVIVKQDKRNMDTLYFSDKFIDNVLEDINRFQSEEMKTIYTRLGITYKRCYLFEGPPGSGKSSLIYGLASHLNLDIAYLNINDELKSSQLIESIRKIPDKSILVIEDIDAIFDKREKIEATHRITFSTLLNCIDGVIKPSSGSIIIFTTNFKNKLDEALKRPGRIDKIVTFEYARKEAIEKMFKMYFPKDVEKFDEFYKKIKNLKKLTICYLQQYFLRYLTNTENISENIEELNKIIDECDLYKQPINLYN